MKHAQVLFQGAVHSATERDGHLWLETGPQRGQAVGHGAVTWLPPLKPTPRPRTILALGLNYADHAKELEFKAPEEPLVFIKGEGSLIGHRQNTIRPKAVGFMHYECELTVVVGKTAKKVQRDDAYDFIAGYTVANDYAIRDYLENWYRPNLRVKNRDGGTVLGPWLVSADEVPDPQALALRTTVNGRVVQQGHTSNMVHTVAALIEYLSDFMTLAPGDIILTGTPEGTVNCNAGDEIACEIDGIGRLVNTLVADTPPAA